MGKYFFELSNPQNSIWMTEQFYSHTNINNICGIFQFNAKIHINILKTSIQQLVKQNDALRLRILLKNTKPVQYVADFEIFDIPVVSLSNEKDLSDLKQKMATNKMEIIDSPLFRFTIFQFPNGFGGYVVTVHHLAADALTLGLIGNTIYDIYQKLIKKEKMEEMTAFSYIDYLNSEKEYLNSEKFKQDETYWNELYATVPETATIPATVQGNSENLHARRESFSISKERTEQIKQYCKEHHISLYHFFMAIFSLYIGRVSNLDDFVIGTPILNRTNFKEKHTLGMFISNLPFRVTIQQEKTFAQYASAIATQLTTMLRHQRYPYQYLLENLRKKDASLPNLYHISLSYQITKASAFGSGCTTEWIPSNHIADDMQIHFYDLDYHGNINIAYDYRTEKYTREEIIHIQKRIEHILNQILVDDNLVMKNIEIVTPEEKHQILYGFNNTKVDYPKDKTIVELFEEQVEKTPDNIAVVFEQQKLTYRELNEKANRLANYLFENGITNHSIVGIVLNRSLEMIVSILAVLKARGAYLPIDPNYPTDRIQYILEDSSSSLIISTSDLSNKITITTSVIYLDLLTAELESLSVNNLRLSFSSDDLAYVIYTSGSTGLPKGVLLKHLSLSNLVNYCNHSIDYLKDPVYRAIVSVTTISFDIFIFETLISLQKGLKLIIANDNEQTIPSCLDNIIEKENIQIIQTTPSRMKLFLNHINDMPHFHQLTHIILAGEPLPISLTNQLLSITGGKLYNGYGPSETTVFSTLTDVTNYNKITIGKPLFNTQIYILDKYRNICPVGVPGELYISGDGVGKGYIHKPDLTKEHFIPNPFIPDTVMYKTGDIGYFQANGEIVCLGRVDNQIKIRGLRIELDEIEKQICSISNISNCVVVKKVSSDSHEFLSAYYTSVGPVNSNSIRVYLQKKLPNYMVPQYFTKLDTLPYTPNGKVDKKALPMPNMDMNKHMIPARNHIDTLLLEYFKKTLSIEKISIEDSFYALGADSLTAINLSIYIQKNLNIQLSAKSIFEYSCIKDLSDYLNTLSHTIMLPIDKAPKKEFYPLSSAQKQIYYASSFDDSSLYNICGGIIFHNQPDVSKLETCFHILIERHEILRTYFESENDEIVQKILPSFEFKLEVIESTTSNLESIFKQFTTPFHLAEKSPKLKAYLIKLSNHSSLLLVNIHHIICDGQSLFILFKELSDLYNNKKLEETKINYKDFSVWENQSLSSETFSHMKNFWLKQFQGEIPVLNLPTSHPRLSTRKYSGANVYEKIDEDLTKKLKNMSKNLTVTPYMFLLSIYYILLSKYSSQNDIIVGTPVIGRNKPELSNMLGMFVNTLPLRHSINTSLSFKDFLLETKSLCVNALKNQNYPFYDLVQSLNLPRDPSRNTPFDVMFVYQNNGYPELKFNKIKSETYIPNSNTSKFDLTLEIFPVGNYFKLNFEYCNQLFEKNFISRLSNHYMNILKLVLNNPDIKLSEIDLLSDAERHQLLVEFNHTNLDYPNSKNMIDLFEEQVRKTPNHIAIKFEDQALTYFELNQKANQLARCLISHNISLRNIVGIMLPRSFDTVICMLAILKCGCVYLLIDPNLPSDRISYMLENCNASLLITNSEKAMFSTKQININENVDLYDTTNLNHSLHLNEPFSVVYTSGSTGMPKGILTRHKSIMNLLFSYADMIELDDCNHFLSICSVAFDMFAVEIFFPLYLGKTIVLTNEEEQKNPIAINQLLIKQSIDFILITPSRLELLLENPSLENIKSIQLGGENLTQVLYNKLVKLTNANIYNQYGPSEITSCCSIKKISSPSDITIGKPLYNTQIYILDENLFPCPIGVPGEICIAGDGVSLGYIHNPTLTEKSFKKNPFGNGLLYKSGDLGKYQSNGEIEFIGRIDNQIKIRGLRVELSEIENQLLKIKPISNCAVIYKKQEEYISAFVTSPSLLDTSDIRNKLSKVLPLYMVPKYITQIDALPVTTNGKLDKRLLDTYVENKSESKHFVPPTTKEEKLCCDIWEKLLNRKVGITDNIFELGADSLLAIKFKTLLFAQNIDIPYADIFRYPQIKDLCNRSKVIPINHIGNYDYSRINPVLHKNHMTYFKPPIAKTCNNLLLLGANGFVGMHILKEFIEKDKGNIYCIVRDKNKELAIDRFIDTLHFYFGNTLDSYIDKRIFIIKGNILKENFDLSTKVLNQMTNDINIVINAASLVKHYGNEKTFDHINIDSTQNAINFCISSHKRLLHISSLSISGNAILEGDNEPDVADSNITFSEDNLFVGQKINNVYIKSKFEAEKLILENIVTNHLHAQILRLGNITSRASDGQFQINPNENAFVRKLQSLILLGVIPDYLLNLYLEFTPVDICAQVIVLLMQNYVENFSVFHIYNHQHVYMDSFIDMLAKLDIPLKVVTSEEFDTIIHQVLEKNSNILDGIINDFDKNRNISYKSNIRILSDFTCSFLAKLGFTWPTIDLDYIHKYIKYLNKIHLI